MLNAYERQLILFYLSNAAACFHRSFPEKKEELAEWVAEYRDRLALNHETEEPGAGEHQASRPYEKELSAREWKDLRKTLEEEYAAACRGGRKDRIARRLRRLGREMDLAPEDLAFIALWLHKETQPIFASLTDCFESSSRYSRQPFFNVAHPILPCILGVPAGAFRARFAADAPLVKSGLVSVDNDGDIQIVRRLLRLVFAPDASDLDVCSLLLDAATPGELEWSDFDHVAEERDHIEKLVQGALSTGKPGVNILVYGPPGTGKTEFCKTLAARLGKSLYSVGEEDGRGDDPRRDERLQELRLAQRLLAPGRGSILLFDEMEDLLANPSSGWMPFSSRSFPHLRAGGSKVFLNRLLERTSVPTLWTSNSARATCPTVLRRMTFALELRKPPSPVRARIWKRELARRDIKATEQDARSLAKEFNVTPGIASGAIAAASLCGGDLTAVRLGVRSLSQVIVGEKPPANQGPPDRFDPVLIRADIDPVEFAGSSLLADRQSAVRSWEVSQVNEMLTWMESHPLPFACTTNFGDNLDPATLRRFTFKIALDYLTPDQSQAAFCTYFALKPPPEVAGLTILTPGDFAVVRRKAEILEHLQDAKALAELLRAECEAKPNHWRKVGF